MVSSGQSPGEMRNLTQGHGAGRGTRGAASKARAPPQSAASAQSGGMGTQKPRCAPEAPSAAAVRNEPKVISCVCVFSFISLKQYFSHRRLYRVKLYSARINESEIAFKERTFV